MARPMARITSVNGFNRAPPVLGIGRPSTLAEATQALQQKQLRQRMEQQQQQPLKKPDPAPPKEPTEQSIAPKGPVYFVTQGQQQQPLLSDAQLYEAIQEIAADIVDIKSREGRKEMVEGLDRSPEFYVSFTIRCIWIQYLLNYR